MKTLKVYCQGSIFKYPNLYQDFSYGLDDRDIITVYERDTSTGEENPCACFKAWDYFLIEKDFV